MVPGATEMSVELFDVIEVEDAIAEQPTLGLPHIIDGQRFNEQRILVIRGERFPHIVVTVSEIEHKGALLVWWADAVEPRKCLHAGDAR